MHFRTNTILSQKNGSITATNIPGQEAEADTNLNFSFVFDKSIVSN